MKFTLNSAGAGLRIQNCGCKITFNSRCTKFVGADLKKIWGIKALYQKRVGAGAPTAPTLTWPLRRMLQISLSFDGKNFQHLNV